MKIETERVILRPIAWDDKPAIVALINNYEVSKWLSKVVHPYGEENAVQFLTAVLEDGRPDLDKPFAITFKEKPDDMIGCIGAEPGRTEDGYWSADAEFGYWLGEEYWGQGILSEAAPAMVRLGLRCAGYERLTAGYINGNEKSARILAACGFVETGDKAIQCLARGTEEPGRDLILTRERWEARQ